jgi:hypothetical protein
MSRSASVVLRRQSAGRDESPQSVEFRGRAAEVSACHDGTEHQADEHAQQEREQAEGEDEGHRSAHQRDDEADDDAGDDRGRDHGRTQL